MYWRPGVEVFWREEGASQVGADAEHAVVLTGLSPGQQRLLAELARMGDAGTLATTARRLGVGRLEAEALVARLPAGLLAAAPFPVLADAALRHRQRESVAGLAGTWPLGRSRPVRGPGAPEPRPPRGRVLVDGLDTLGLALALGLPGAGADRLELRDPQPVTTLDLSPGGYRAADLGRPRERVAVEALRALHPRLPARVARAGAPVALVVLVGSRVADPVRYRRYLAEDLPHLSVLSRDLDVQVGPLVRPGLGPCLRCLDLARTGADPRWPAVATQALGRRHDGGDPVLRAGAVALALHQVRAFLHGRPLALEGNTLQVDLAHPQPLPIRHAFHPDCGCGAVPAAAQEHASPRP